MDTKKDSVFKDPPPVRDYDFDLIVQDYTLYRYQFYIDKVKDIFNPDLCDPMSEMSLNPYHGESARIRRDIKSHLNYLLQKEKNRLEDIRFEKETEEYNQWFYSELMARKQYNQNKKKLKQSLMGAIFNLLFAGEEDSCLKPCLVPLPLVALAYYRIFAHNMHVITRVSPVKAIEWARLRIIHRLPEWEDSPDMPPLRYMHIYAGLYRSWLDQNVIQLRRARVRGPPFKECVTIKWIIGKIFFEIIKYPIIYIKNISLR